MDMSNLYQSHFTYQVTDHLLLKLFIYSIHTWRQTYLYTLGSQNIGMQKSSFWNMLLLWGYLHVSQRRRLDWIDCSLMPLSTSKVILWWRIPDRRPSVNNWQTFQHEMQWWDACDHVHSALITFTMDAPNWDKRASFRIVWVAAWTSDLPLQRSVTYYLTKAKTKDEKQHKLL